MELLAMFFWTKKEKNIAIKTPVGSTVLNYIEAAQKRDVFLQKEACSGAVPPDYFVI